MQGLYIHIPFCIKLCPFCSFPTLVLNQKRKQSYIQFLLQEIELWKEKTASICFDSVYIGGGTPSCLSFNELNTLFTAIRTTFFLSNQVEISFEMNPENVMPSYMQALFSLGINRISLGVQSLQEESLQILGRNHTAIQAIQAIEDIKKAGFSNINLDFMFAYKNQNKEKSYHDFEELCKYNSEHLSIYWLTLEGKTKYARDISWQTWQEDNEKENVEMYYALVEIAKQKQYIQYEVSNFSKIDKHSRQNELVWRGDDFIGLGLGAHGYWQGYRFANTNLFPDYIARLQEKKRPLLFNDLLTEENKRDESLLLGLRTKKGVNWDLYAKHLNSSHYECAQSWLQNWQEQGLLSYEQGHIFPTSKGFLWADQIALELSNLFAEK